MNLVDKEKSRKNLITIKDHNRKVITERSQTLFSSAS
jgi:hypothetical protein